MSATSRAALILIDLQRDFLSRPELEPHPAALTANAARWLANWRASGLPVAHVFTRVARAPDRRMAHWREADLWTCEQDTPGEQPPPELAPLASEAVFYKTGYLPAVPSEIATWVRSVGAAQIVLAGAMTHACVAHLAAALLSEGLRVSWAGDALGSDRPQAAAHVLAHLATKGVRDFAPVAATLSTPAADVNSAVRAAQAAWRDQAPAWPGVRPALLAWAEAIEAETEQLAREVTHAVNKPIAMAREEVRHAAASVRDAVRWRDAFITERHAAAGGVATRRPLGVVAVLTPWNNPVSIPVGRLAPALAYGNVVIWKPAPAMERVSRRLLDLARRAGLRDEHLGLCLGEAETGRRLVWHPQVDAITFSGSLARGRLVLAAGTERLVPCQLEMGGNNAAIIDEETDTAAATEAVLAGAFSFAGQRCTANRRVILLPGARDSFLRHARAGLARWTPRDPFDETARIGPVKDEDAAQRIERVLARAASAGARITRADAPAGGAWVAPALVENVAEDAEIVREETFGPVLVVQEARDWADALRLLNAVPQGLVAALFSRSEERWQEFQTHARAGVLRRDSATAGALDDLPFGGWKASGYGGAEHAEADADFFTRHQTRINPRSAHP